MIGTTTELPGALLCPICRNISAKCGPDWTPVRDGFGKPTGRRSASDAAIATCDSCGRELVVVRRVLDTGAYELPDAVIYQRLLRDKPAIALGLLEREPSGDGKKGRTTAPEPTPEIRGRWQGMLWELFQVAFVEFDPTIGLQGDFCPASRWEEGDTPDHLGEIADCVRDELERVWARHRVEVGTDSRTCEVLVRRVLERSLQGWEYQTRKARDGFWCSFRTDGGYRNCDTGESLALEVKAGENWIQPVNQCLKNLLHFSGVLVVRLSACPDALPVDVRAHVTRAEGILEKTGRVRFISIWPEV